MRVIARSDRRAAVALLAALAYLPLLLQHPGRLPADTKLGLTLDPWRLMTDSVSSWDTAQFAGWVPHQAISYLWPSGPFYWLTTSAGVPAWLAQRLFAGSVLLCAGLGVRWLLRGRGYSSLAALVAALVYQLSPYVLPYVSRTSLMLLPWAGLPWLVGLAVRATGTGRGWVRPTAAFGLVVATVGGINLTATAMIAPGPLLALWWAAVSGQTTGRRALLTTLRLGSVSLAVSLWWLVMLGVQGRYGADVLGYSETLEAVSTTTTAPEVLRGMGYWLAYIDGPSGPTTTGALPYTTAPWLVAAGSVLVVVALSALATLRFAERRLAAGLVLVGTVLAVGVHPLADPSPLMQPIADDTRSTLALALRSSTRAIPLLVLGLALCVAAVVQHSARSPRRSRALVPLALAATAIVNLPALVSGELVDPGLLHDQRPPREWSEALARVDAVESESRILQVPGVESQAFTWGYTVDPPLAWLSDRPLVTRDWLPLGSPAVMDLLYAFDDRFQDGTAEPDGVAAIARFLAVGTFWSARDLDWGKFGSVDPFEVEQVLGAASGVTEVEGANDHVALFDVDDALSVVRVGSRTVVVHGSGDGIIDAAAAGLLDGSEAVVYAADLSDDELSALVAEGAVVLLTDSNRDRAHQWRGSRDVVGFTEAGDDSMDVLDFDPQDARLPVFATTDVGTRTTAHLDGITVRASSYGSHLRLLPEQRPAMAVDGRADTAWVVGSDYGPTLGARLELADSDGTLRISQPDGPVFVTRAEITRGDVSRTIEFADASDVVETTVPGTGAITIRIVGVSGPGPVGFSELLPTAHPETVRTPALRTVVPPRQFAAVLTRLRTGDERRTDPEPVLRRSLDTPRLMSPTWTITLTGGLPDAGCNDDLLVVDGTAVPLRIGGDDVESFVAGRPATLEPCSEVALTAGRHELTAATGVDRIVLSDASARIAPSRTTPTATAEIERGHGEHVIRLTGCPDGCWLIFGEGYSDGWSARSDTAELGRHTAVAGGFNGWWVEPRSDGRADVVVRWSGHRPALLGLLASGLTVALLVTALTRRRHWRFPHPTKVARIGSTSWRHTRDVGRTLLASLCSVAAVAIAVGPAWAVAAVAPAALAVVTRRRALLPLFAAVSIGGVFGLFCARMVTHRRVPDFQWALQFERLHRPLLTAIVALTIATMLDRDDAARAAPANN